MGGKQPKKPGALRQGREPVMIIIVQLAIEWSRTNAFARKEQAQRDDFARVEMGIRVLGHINHHAIDPNEQFNDKILGRHANLPVSDDNTLTMAGSRVSVKISPSTIG